MCKREGGREIERGGKGEREREREREREVQVMAQFSIHVWITTDVRGVCSGSS